MSRMDDLREPAHARSTGTPSALVPDKILYPCEPRRPHQHRCASQPAYNANNIQIYMFMILLITTGLGIITVGHVFRIEVDDAAFYRACSRAGVVGAGLGQ